MTAVLAPAWHAPANSYFAAMSLDRVKPSLRVIPSQNANMHELAPSPSTLNPAAISPGAYLSPASPTSPASSSAPSLKQKMRSFTVRKPLTHTRKWERLSEKDKTASHCFARDAIALCGLSGFSWTKTYSYLRDAAVLPLPPYYVQTPDEPIQPDDSNSASAASSSRPSSSGQHLLPDSASTLVSSRPTTSSSGTLTVLSSTSSTIVGEKEMTTRLRLVFEEMQKLRDPAYVYYINLPGNSLKKMHEHAVKLHRQAVLRKERSTLMDKINFDKDAAHSEGKEFAVAKLRFEMELDASKSLKDASEAGPEVKAETQRDGAIKSSRSTSSIGSTLSGLSLSSLRSRPESNDLRRDAVQNNRVSAVPTIVTTTSDILPSQMRPGIITSLNDERPESPASFISAKTEGHVHQRDTWTKLQDARRRLSSRSSRSRVDGTPSPGTAQNLDHQGFFAHRPTN